MRFCFFAGVHIPEGVGAKRVMIHLYSIGYAWPCITMHAGQAGAFFWFLPQWSCEVAILRIGTDV
jgi:hypothetical protein